METPSAERTREILRKVRQIEIRSRKAVDEAMIGAYHSVFKGTGINFAEVREYQAGDDVRSIDWNVTARMDRPFVKVYTEERELTIILAVDVSASHQFGSTEESKRELAAELASVLAYSATRNQDKVGLLLFTDQVETYIPPRKGRQHTLRLIREILFFTPQRRGTDLVGALRFLNRVRRRKAICFVLSDFLTPQTLAWSADGESDDLHRMLRLTHRRHDLICVDLSDPRERELPPVGWVTLEDAETGEIVEINTRDPEVRARYRALNDERHRVFQFRLRKLGIDLLSLRTGSSYIEVLRAFFKKREARR